MWDIMIKLKDNPFKIVKNRGNQFYLIVDDNENIINKNVKKWFNNGFVLCKNYIEAIGEDSEGWADVDSYYLYSILDASLKEICSFKTNKDNYEALIDDYIDGYLPLIEPKYRNKYGAIDEAGNTVLGYKYSIEEVKHRINLKCNFNSSLDNNSYTENELKETILIYTYRYQRFKNTSHVEEFLSDFFAKHTDVYDILFHLHLIGEAYFIIDQNSRTNWLNYFDISENNKHLIEFDLYFLIKFIKEKMDYKGSLWALNFSFEKNNKFDAIENEIFNYFSEEDTKIVEFRKSRLSELCNELPFEKFEHSKYDLIRTKYLQCIKSSDPLVKGRKVFIKDFFTLESNYKEKKATSNPISCVYFIPADFLNPQTSMTLHVLRNTQNSDLYYIVDAKSVNLDLKNYTYLDYLDLLK